MTISKTKSQIFKLGLSIIAVLGIIFSSFLLLIPENSKAQNLNEQKIEQAKSMDFPTAEFNAEPSYLVKKGGEVSLFANFQNYAGEGNEAQRILYNWCIDDIPINSIMAGSSDEVVQEGSNVIVKNQYGEFQGGKGSCNISSIYDPNDYVLVNDSATGAAEAQKRLQAVFTADDQLAFQRYLTTEYINRLRRIGVNGIALQFFRGRVEAINNDQNLSDADKQNQLRTLRDDFANSNGLSVNAGDFSLAADSVGIGGFFNAKAANSYAALSNTHRTVTSDKSIFVTRKPKASDDIDGDGMSDAWEIQNFGKFAGKKGVKLKDPDAPDQGFSAVDFFPQFVKDVTGINNPGTVDISPINFGASTPEGIYLDFLKDIKPEHDYDGDGFVWGENYGRCVQDFFQNAPKESAVKKAFDGETCWYTLNSGLGTGWAIFLSILTGFPIPAGSQTILPGPVHEAWQVGVPYVKLSGKNDPATGQYDGYEIKIDNGYFPNGAEFVFGTNPLEADTDADGVPDAYDVAGLKQNSVPLKIQKDDDYSIDVHLFGMSQKGSLIRGSIAQKDSYNNTPYLFWRTDLEDQVLKVGGGLPLPTQLTYSPFPATIDNAGCSGNACAEPIRVEAATASGDIGSGSFFYTWYLDGIILPADEAELSTGSGANKQYSEDVGYLKALGDRSAFNDEANRKNSSSAQTQNILRPSGFGKNSFEFNIFYGKTLWDKVYTKWTDLGPCAEREVGVDVLDSETGKTSHSEIKIPIGASVELNDKLITNVDPSKDDLLSGFNLNDLSIRNQIIKDAIVPILNDQNASDILAEVLANRFVEDPTASQIDRKKGYRRGDLVSVEANINQANSQCEAGYYDSLIYKWYFDDLYLENESGRGKKSVIVAMSNLGTDLRDQEDSASHYLRFEAVDPKTNQIFSRGLKELRVIKPYIEFDPTGSEGQANVATGGVASYTETHRVQPGANVTVTAKPKYFRPLPDGSGGLGFDYEWYRDDQLVQNTTVQGRIPAEVQLTFVVDSDAAAFDKVTLEISTNQDAALATDSEARESAVSDIVFDANAVDDGSADISFGAASAALSRFIPEQYRQAFNGAFIFGGFALLAVLAMALYRGRQEKA